MRRTASRYRCTAGTDTTRDFNVEQLYRDNRLNAIHEGTHAIHGLDLLGRKVTMDSGAGLRVLLNAITASITRAERCREELRAWLGPSGPGQADRLGH